MFYVTIKGADKDHDYKVEKKAKDSYELTDIENNKSFTFKVGDFDLDYGALLRFNIDGENKLI